MSTLQTNDYDFGFSFADDDSLPTSSSSQQTNEEISELKDKLDALLSAQEQNLNSAMVNAIEEKYKAKLKEVEGLILPLLLNLKKNPEKAYINWPNRVSIIDKQIEKITKVTRG
jgi:phosphoglycerate-specific signal transduction histidine kinase